MGIYKIEGKHRLEGRVGIHGAKNAALPIIAATVLNGRKNVIHNCPYLSDIESMTEILRYLGCTVTRAGNDLIVDSESLSVNVIPCELMCKTRSSVLFAGALSARSKRVSFSSCGGCSIGERPIDIHLKAFSELGVEVKEGLSAVCLDSSEYRAGKVIFPFPSVGATENIMLIASLCPEVTTVINAAAEPEIVNLADFLRSIGVEITGDGTPVMKIKGTLAPEDGEVSVIGDRIVASTYAVCTAVSGGSVDVSCVNPSHLSCVLAQLRKMGCHITIRENGFLINSYGRTGNVPVTVTEPYPGFPTDSQPLLVSLMSVSTGVGVVRESIFENRFGHCKRLSHMGADICVRGSCASVKGVKTLKGSSVDCCDLRCGAALVCAGLGAEGVTTISNTHYIERGYEDICGQLKLLGASIERID